MSQHYTRDSLRAAWESIEPTSQLSNDLRTLCLMFVNYGTVDVESDDTAHQHVSARASMPPPRRFVRRVLPEKISTAPCGPVAHPVSSQNLEAGGASQPTMMYAKRQDMVPFGPNAEIQDLCSGTSAAKMGDVHFRY
jgi:hypothetical protein